jgi:hypothetical protein
MENQAGWVRLSVKDSFVVNARLPYLGRMVALIGYDFDLGRSDASFPEATRALQYRSKERKVLAFLIPSRRHGPDLSDNAVSRQMEPIWP